jgi:hypothetical protein
MMTELNPSSKCSTEPQIKRSSNPKLSAQFGNQPTLKCYRHFTVDWRILSSGSGAAITSENSAQPCVFPLARYDPSDGAKGAKTAAIQGSLFRGPKRLRKRRRNAATYGTAECPMNH